MAQTEVEERDEEIAELRRERIKRYWYLSTLIRHANCRDPDHPGCERCEPNMDEDE